MFSFLQKNYAVGVDFGTSSIKVVELYYRDGKIHLNNYGSVSLDLSDPSESMKGGLSFEARRRSYFLALLAKMKIKNQENIFVSMPGFSGLVSLVEFPNMSDEELSQAIQFEGKKYIPADTNEVALSWDIVKREQRTILEKIEKNKKSEKIEVLLVAALKKDVAQVESIIQGTQYKLKAIELETFSLSRSLVGEDLGTYLIIDIGFKVCNFILVHKGIVRANRNIDIGGNEITNTIAESMNITWDRAEQLKKTGKNFLQDNELSVVFPSLDLVVNESKRILVAFQEKNSQLKVDKIILSGGSSGLSGLSTFFQQKFGIESEIGDPWRKISFDESVEKHIRRMGASYSVAIGLALRGIEEYQRS